MFLDRIKEDIKSAMAKDPAAKTGVEVFLCYPGLHAIWYHRIAHWLYNRKLYLLARMVSQASRFLTGIEIHPGATLGKRVFIDHGMGIVIGETAEVGDDTLLYKGVVLGGTSLEKKKRHPTVGKNVVIGSNACVLGPVTIGDGARIGSGSVVVKDVPAGATVVGIPGKVVEKDSKRKLALDFEHGNLPDPIADVVKIMLKMQHELEERLKVIEKDHSIKAKSIFHDYEEKAAEELPDQ
ncbi:MAG: serine O-acetyltransferase [Candidatus Omnitrophica bacterium]|nr:serine O-acetyltransferase [Candidatus Omnitrophota bacterium]MBU1933195.1 serine O-acetyltransferase [Candidatus Omnitrophota bacterium]